MRFAHYWNLAAGNWVVSLLVLALLSAGHAAAAARGNEPVVVKTAWGQRVVPDIDTYADMMVYARLKPGQSWAEGSAIRAEILEKYRKGEIKLSRRPWRVADRVFVLGRDDRGQLIYLLDTGDGLLLIDPSYDTWQELLISQIKELGYEASDVRWVLITHCHVDHAQSCHQWRKRGAEIIVPDLDVHPVESGNQVTAWWLVDEPDRHFTGCKVDRRVYDGDRLDFGDMTLYAIWTPGHTPGSTCYYMYHDGRNILFSEDIALHNGRHAWMGHPYADWDQYLKSLYKLANYKLNGRPVEYDMILPGHGVVELEGAMRSVKETIRVVKNIIARRKSGEKIDWIDPYSWNWKQGITYR